MSETNYDKSLNQALRSAVTSLKERNLEEIAFKSGASCDEGKTLKLSFLNRSATVNPFQEEVLIDSMPADKRTSILILHYLLRASGSPLTGQMIGFKEVPQGSLYFQPFRNRVILSLLGLLEKDPGGFEECARLLGAERVDAGDLSFRFRVFPYVTTQFVWYQGEEGIPGNLNLLFDASISEYLSTEDIVVMCEEINRNLKSSSPRKDETGRPKVRGKE